MISMLPKKEYLSKMWVGDPKHQREVFNERFQETSTCGMGMQIPPGLVSQVSLQDSERRSRKISSRYHKATMRMEEGGNTGRQYPSRPYPSGCVDATEVFRIRVGGFCERQECDQDIRQASGTEASVLGSAFLGERILCQYRRTGRGPNQEICTVATKKRPNHRATQVMEKVI